MNNYHANFERESLTLRELEVLSMIAVGLTNLEISKNLYISPETVKWYAKQIYPKLGVSNRTQAALKAGQLGLVEFGYASSKKEHKTRKLSNFPAQLTSYIGRSQEISTIKSLILKKRLVTLTGSGGIGKTRLGLQVVSQLWRNFRDGVWLIECGQISDPTQVLSAIAKVLSVVEKESTPLEATLKDYLSNKNMLLLIDNFEHLLSAAPFVSDLLANGANISVLVTSRQRLHIYGEVEYSVPPLALPDFQSIETAKQILNYDSIALFIARVKAVKPTIKLNEDQLQDVVKICRQLDGLPLAIELAAPLVKLFSLSSIAERLKHDLDSLPRGPRDLPSRQQTLRGTLEWSYKLLNADEKALFTNLAVFVGGGTLEAIEFVCGDQGYDNLLDTLSSLVNRNLLIPKEGRDGEMRFTMLETTHQLIKDRLIANGNSTLLYENHAAYYVDMAERALHEYGSPQNKYWFKHLQLEQNNLNAAFEWAKKNGDSAKCLLMVFALRTYWRNYGYAKQALHWAETALAISDRLNSAMHAGALLAAGDLCLDLFQDERAVVFLNEALEIFRQLNDQQNSAWCIALLSLAEIGHTHDFSRGMQMLQASLDIFRQLNDKSGMVSNYMLLGEMARMAEDYDTAKRNYDKSLELAKVIGEQMSEGIGYINLGLLAYQIKEFEVAENFTKQGLRIFLDMDIDYGVILDIGGLAGAALGLGKPKRAARLLGFSNAGLEVRESYHQQADYAVIAGILDETKRALDEKSFLAAWQKGQRMTIQEAFAYALGNGEDA